MRLLNPLAWWRDGKPQPKTGPKKGPKARRTPVKRPGARNLKRGAHKANTRHLWQRGGIVLATALVLAGIGWLSTSGWIPRSLERVELALLAASADAGLELGDVLVEPFIAGRELTVAVMGDRALAVTEIQAKTGFYDYDAKYTDGRAVHVIPAQIGATATQAALDAALAAHRALGCRGVSRSDFRYDDTGIENGGIGDLYWLEVNTQPGMTALSLVPEQAAHLGISFPEICAWMVENAACDS